MRHGPWRGILSAVALCIAAMAIASCASTGMDGGIVGSGNRDDCEARAAKDGTAPQDCRREARQ